MQFPTILMRSELFLRTYLVVICIDEYYAYVWHYISYKYKYETKFLCVAVARECINIWMAQESDVILMSMHFASVEGKAARRMAVSHSDKGIVISGDPGSGKSTLVYMLSEEYGKEVYAVGLYWRNMYKKEHPDGSITFEEYWGTRSDRDQLEANRSLRHYAQDLGYIVDTRYASIFDKERCLIIYLRAPLEVRAERLARRPEYSGKALEEIEAILRKRQDDEVAIGKRLFGVDYRDRNLYHLILDTSLLTPEEELSAVKSEMRKLMSLVRKDR